MIPVSKPAIYFQLLRLSLTFLLLSGSVLMPSPLTMSNAIPEILIESSNFDHDELNRLLARFMKIDTDSSGTIEKDEFLAVPTIQSNPLAARLVELFDSDGNGNIDFGEFVSALSIFSSKGKRDEKLKFAFNVFDIDKDGFLSNGELFIILKKMVGDNLQNFQLQQIVDKTIIEADSSGTGTLNFADFMKVVDGSSIAESLTLDTF